MLVQIETHAIQAADDDIVIGADQPAILDKNGAGRAAEPILLDRIARVETVRIAGIGDDPEIGRADRHGIATAQTGAPDRRDIEIALQQRCFCVDQAGADILQIFIGEGGAALNTRTAVERGLQDIGDVACAIVKTGPVGRAAIIGIAKLAGGFRVDADAQTGGQEILFRQGCGGKVDDAAAKFSGIVDRIAFLHRCAGQNARREQVQRNDALERLGRGQGRAVQQGLRIAIAQTADIDEAAIVDRQAGHALQRAGDIAVALAGNIFGGQHGNDGRGAARLVGNETALDDNLVPQTACAGCTDIGAIPVIPVHGLIDGAVLIRGLVIGLGRLGNIFTDGRQDLRRRLRECGGTAKRGGDQKPCHDRCSDHRFVLYFAWKEGGGPSGPPPPKAP